MYRPEAFREDRVEVLHALMRAHPLAMLVTGGESGLMANPVPFLVKETASGAGVLHATWPGRTTSSRRYGPAARLW